MVEQLIPSEKQLTEEEALSRCRQWGGDLSGIDFDDIYYYVRATDRQQRSWDEVPEEIKYTFDRLGIPEAERKFLAGAGAQFESEVVYHSIRKDLEEKGVIFLDMDSALREHPDLFREYWATVIPPTITSSRRSTARSGQAARSSTCRKACMSRCLCRRISASTPTTWVSLSAR
jgi:Fe-S cluster assembly scaffold protein SufB